jgi:alkanesulfonate monooxygenase SsuD/methylene tetrahydromethanopterin reductase-like flavin-dependent oxidoreductase (luciferase family)
MIGTETPGPRMRRLIAQYADLWNGWLTYDREPPYSLSSVQTTLDEACLSTRRDPTTLERTVCITVALDGHQLIYGSWKFTDGALKGSPEELADAFRLFAQQGVSQLQLILAPSTLEGLDAFAPVLALLDQG